MLLRLSCVLLLCLRGALAGAAEVDWEPFATSRSAVVFFDRSSVKKSDDYVHYRIRVEYTDERVSRDGKHRYRSAVNALAVYHDYAADVGSSHFGGELNLQLIARTERMTLTLKYADYRADALLTDTTKAWLSVDYAF